MAVDPPCNPRVIYVYDTERQGYTPRLSAAERERDELRRRVAELEAKLSAALPTPPKGTET